MNQETSGSYGGVTGWHPAMLLRLRALQALSARGQRQMVLLTGEAGTGKTALIDDFLALLTTEHRGHTPGRARCLPGRARHEPYRPLLEALGQRLRALPDNGLRTELIRRIAPSWKIPLTALLTPAQEIDWRRCASLPDLMPQELADLIDLLGETQPLVLVLEDMHWGDQSSLDLVSLLAERRSRAQVMILLAYRSSNAVLASNSLHSLQHRLAAWGQAQPLSLDGFAPQESLRYPDRPETRPIWQLGCR